MSRMLAISSGGDHSAYVLGMLKGVFANRPTLTEWDNICGVSAGALIGSTVASIDKEDRVGFLKNINHLMSSHLKFAKNWTPLGAVANIAKAFFWHDSLYKGKMQDIIKSEWKGNFKRQLFVGAFNKTRGLYETFGPSPNIKQVAASASVPVVFPSVQIQKMQYEDGAVAHIIPVREIRQHWQDGDLDLMLCYPTEYKEFLKTSDYESRFALVGSAWHTISESAWMTYNQDLDNLADLCGQDIRGGGVFSVGDKTLRVYVPKKGHFVDFTERNWGKLHTMHQHGEEVASEMFELK
jgi:predicted patatin/cPLA2 family phospholipase